MPPKWPPKGGHFFWELTEPEGSPQQAVLACIGRMDALANTSLKTCQRRRGSILARSSGDISTSRSDALTEASSPANERLRPTAIDAMQKSTKCCWRCQARRFRGNKEKRSQFQYPTDRETPCSQISLTNVAIKYMQLIGIIGLLITLAGLASWHDDFPQALSNALYFNKAKHVDPHFSTSTSSFE